MACDILRIFLLFAAGGGIGIVCVSEVMENGFAGSRMHQIDNVWNTWDDILSP